MLNKYVDWLKQQAIPCHGIDDPGHGKQGPQEGYSESSYGAHRHDILCEHTAMHGKHLHERGVCVDLIVRYHQSQDHRNLDGRGLKKKVSKCNNYIFMLLYLKPQCV